MTLWAERCRLLPNYFDPCYYYSHYYKLTTTKLRQNSLHTYRLLKCRRKHYEPGDDVDDKNVSYKAKDEYSQVYRQRNETQDPLVVHSPTDISAP